MNTGPRKVVNLTIAGLTPAEVQALPTDPAALRAKLVDPDLALTGMVGQLLSTGVGVQFESDAWKTLFLVDPHTGDLLATRSIGHKELPGRDIDDWRLVLDSGRRDDAPTPTGRTLTIPVA